MKLIVSTLVAISLLLTTVINGNVLTAGGSNISVPSRATYSDRGCC
ncbi:MAG: hypothetical protein RL228_381 [Actinomycetota bacterium]|jgi:hypothetical protein